MTPVPPPHWLEAVRIRGSRRSYDPRPLPPKILDRIESVCGGFRPFPEARAALVREPVEDVASGILGSYGRVSGAPCYLVFAGCTDSARVQEAVGYTGEGLILETTALGLATCWVGGLFKRGLAAAAAGLTAGETVLGISPVGYPSARAGLTDRTFRALAGSARRKPLTELIVDGGIPDGRLKPALEAARLAPSAMNRQPWRFRLEPGSVTVLTDATNTKEKISRRLDCGIAMIHFELGARGEGLDGAWEFMDAPEVARFRLSATSSFSP
jgi:hypothetical protein